MTNANTIKCPQCGIIIDVENALSESMDTEINERVEKLKKEQEAILNDRLIKKQQELESQQAEKQKKEIEEAVHAASLRQQEELDRLIREQSASQLLLQKQADEKQKLQETLDSKLDELAEKQLALDQERKNLAIENEKKLSEDRVRVEEETRKRIEDDNTLKNAQTAVQMESLRNEAEGYRRKLESASQQLIGEGQEVALEDALRMAFPSDIIEPVQKGIKGADCIQKVRSNGNTVGIIVWESKRTKAWLNEWIPKLKDDMRTLNATLAILVTQTPPSDMKAKADIYEGIWVTDFPTAIPMATALRAGILSVAVFKSLTTNSDGKSQQLLDYIMSQEFRGNMQAIIETYTAFEVDLAAEERAFIKQCKRRRMTITRAMTATHRIYGSLQGLLGEKSMPEIEAIEQKQIES